MSKELVNLANIVPFPKSCELCASKENVQLFAGLMLCGSCQENIRTTNREMFAANNQIEKKAQN